MESKEELEKLEEVLEFIKKENVYAEDIFNQIQFLESMERQVRHMYHKAGKNFQCEFGDRRDKLIEVFDECVDSATEDLGMILEWMFEKRNRLRKEIQEEKDEDIKDNEGARE